MKKPSTPMIYRGYVVDRDPAGSFFVKKRREVLRLRRATFDFCIDWIKRRNRSKNWRAKDKRSA